MQSDKWRKKRKDRIKLSGGKCQKCDSNKNLQVHHKTYEKFGHEDLRDLATLCRDCHESVHLSPTALIKVRNKRTRKQKKKRQQKKDRYKLNQKGHRELDAEFDAIFNI